MRVNKLITSKGLLFLLIFSALVFVGDKINFSRLVGSQSQFFTLFQLFGPVAGAFLGPVVGVLSVLIAEVASKVSMNATWDLVTVLRLTPMLLAAWYFGTRKDKLSLYVPIAAMILFIAHPVGRQVWYFSLFWTIPILLKYAPEEYSNYIVPGIISLMGLIMFATSLTYRNIWMAIGFVAVFGLSFIYRDVASKSLGATFTAHAVGGAIWNYIVPMTPAAWIALIPIVIFERLVFASGITISYIGINTILAKLDTKTKAEYVNVDEKHVLFRQSA
ncbi:MAG TPA: hypothetical protein VJI97_04555 [Candidatus Nanoarchaeia archaeon]|nr:hypothetical protein [Candidatus Nanoarchaeia archaeon]